MSERKSYFGKFERILGKCFCFDFSLVYNIVFRAKCTKRVVLRVFEKLSDFPVV